MAGTADLEALVAEPQAPAPAPEPQAPGELDRQVAQHASTMQLEALLKARDADVSTFRDVLKSAGSGLWNLASMAAGLPASILTWAVKGQQAQTNMTRALAEPDPIKAEAIMRGGGAEAAATDIVESYLPTVSNLNRLGREAGPDPNFKPQTTAGKFAELFTENAIPGVGLGLAVGRAGARGIAQGTVEAGKGFVGSMGERYAASPLGLAGQDLRMNAAATGGQLLARDYAEEKGLGTVESVLAELGGAVVGGVGSELLSAGARGTGRTIRAAVAPTVDESSSWPMKLIAGGTDGKQRLASMMLKGTIASDPDTVVNTLRAKGEYVPGANDFMLPAWASGDIGLSALATGIAMSKTKLGITFRQAEDGLRGHIAGYLDETAGGNMPGAFRPNIGDPSANMMNEANARIRPIFLRLVDGALAQLDERVQLATLEAREGINEVKRMGGDKRAISAAATHPIEQAYQDGRAVMNGLYGMLPNVPAAPTRTRMVMDLIDQEAKTQPNPANYPKQIAEVVKGTNKNLIEAEEVRLKQLTVERDAARADFESGKSGDAMRWSNLERDIEVTRNRLTEMSAGFQLGDMADTDKLRALRSWALQLSAEAAKDTATKPANGTLARYYSMIAEAVDEDFLKAYMKTGNEDFITAANAANQYTRKFHDVFTRGEISEIRGINARRGANVDPSEVLDRMLVPATPQSQRGLNTLEALLDVERFGQEAHDALRRRAPAGVSETPLRDLSEGWLAQHYYDSVTKPSLDGGIEIVPQAHAKFMKDYGKQLDNFPTLQMNLEDSGRRLQKMAEVADNAAASGKAISDPGKNVLQLWLNAEPAQAVAKLRKSDTPGADARKLVEAARQDPTGRAEPALRQIVYEDMLAQVRLAGQRDLSGDPLHSGAQMYRYMRDNDAVLKEVFTPEQRAAMKNVQKELTAAEDAIRTNAVRGQSITAQGTAIRESMTTDATTLQTLIEAAYGGSRATGLLTRALPFIGEAARASTQNTVRDVGAIVQKAIFEDRELLAALLLRPTEKNLPLIRSRLRPYFVTAGDPANDATER